MKMRIFRSKVTDLLEMKVFVTFLGLFRSTKVIDFSFLGISMTFLR